MANDVEEIELGPQVIALVEHHARRFQLNAARARRLLKLQATMDPKDARDVLRAIVVFTHSALEDTLRNVVGEVRKNSHNYRDVPLAGTPSIKFSLSDLHKLHAGKTVSEVLDNSLDEQLSQMTFNNARDLAEVLSVAHLNNPRLKEFFGTLERMIARRHQIVHQADVPREGSAHAPIDAHEVSGWVDSTTEFVAGLLAALGMSRSGIDMEKALLDE